MSTLTTWIGFSLSLVGTTVKVWKIANRIGLFFAIKRERKALLSAHTDEVTKLKNLNLFLKNTMDVSISEYEHLCKKVRNKNKHKNPEEIEDAIQLATKRLKCKKANKLRRKLGAPMFKQLRELHRTLNAATSLTEAHYNLAKEVLENVNKVSNRKMVVDGLELSVNILGLISFFLFTVAPLAPLVPFIFLTLAGLIKNTVKTSTHIYEDTLMYRGISRPDFHFPAHQESVA